MHFFSKHYYLDQHAEFRLETLLHSQFREIKELIMANAQDVKVKLDALTANVAEETTVIASMSTFLDNLEAQMKALQDAAAAAGNIPQDILDEIDALQSAVSANKATITSKITQNTP